MNISGNKGQFCVSKPTRQDMVNYQQVKFINSTFQNNKGLYEGMFIVQSFSNLTISDSIFVNNYGLGRGSIIFTEKNNSKTLIINSQFIDNYSFYGGVIFIQNDAEVNVYGSIFKGLPMISLQQQRNKILDLCLNHLLGMKVIQQMQLRSSLSLENFTIFNSSSQSPIMYISSGSAVEVKILSIQNFSGPLILAQQSNIKMKEINVIDVQNNELSPFVQMNINNLYLSDINISNFSSYSGQPIIRIFHSQGKIQNAFVQSFNSNFLEVTSRRSQLIIQNCQFIKNQAFEDGGSIYLLNADYAITDSYFSKNKAKDTGGALYMSCSTQNDQKNKAEIKGGAIYYDLYRPKNIKANLFDSNQAFYGPDFASYPGKSKIQTSRGSCIFSGLSILGKPNYQSYIFIENGAIDQQKIQKINIQEEYGQSLNQTIYFRECKFGEVNLNQKCQQCSQGYFSLDKNDQVCKKCPNNADCLGGDQIVILSDYWRSSNYSENVFKCLHTSSCLLAQQTFNTLIGEGLILNVERGIQENYAQSVLLTPMESILLELVGTLAVNARLLAFKWSLSLRYSVLNNPKRNKPQTVLLRILMSYFQVIMVCKDFEMEWPSQVEMMLGYFSIFSSSQKNLFSIDCALEQYGFEGSDVFRSKMLFFGALPIILSLISAIVWIIMKLSFRKYFRQIRLSAKIQLTCFAIILLLYPTVISVCFQIFQCFDYEDGNSYVQSYMNIQCWGDFHKQISLFIGFPFIFLWTILFPLIVFYKLKRIKGQLGNPDNLKLYGIFYVGLSDNAYYWEIIIVNSKKLLFILTSVFVPSSSQILKALTLYGGLFFVSKDVQKNEDILTILFIVILLYNAYFMILWIFLFLTTLLRGLAQFLNKLNIKILKIPKIDDYESNLTQYLSGSMKESVKRKTFDKKETMDFGSGFNNQTSLRVIFKQIDRASSLNQSQIAERQDFMIQNIPEELIETKRKSISKNKKVFKKKRVLQKETQRYKSAM
ncbi:UNKNOWN [Stylonychia lemnae]|uniref:Transmembrane protein n=1 Tax=Stylonychia lemnae TaxID=5949 RepID=A0A078A1K2_STYLE|nr:UNKNOWN [Stylonychia lemnae]|eukprot:CDW75727.1 UNKNOWN [Stylonychia lemnae]